MPTKWISESPIIVGTKPLITSNRKQGMPQLLPSTRQTLVAPIFPEPCRRMSMPLHLPKIQPKGIEPHKNASRGQSQRYMLDGLGRCGFANAQVDELDSERECHRKIDVAFRYVEADALGEQRGADEDQEGKRKDFH